MVLGLRKASVWKLTSWLSVALTCHSIEYKKDSFKGSEEVGGRDQSEQGRESWIMCKNHILKNSGAQSQPRWWSLPLRP